jgi:hypothetical protein
MCKPTAIEQGSPGCLCLGLGRGTEANARLSSQDTLAWTPFKNHSPALPACPPAQLCCPNSSACSTSGSLHALFPVPDRSSPLLGHQTPTHVSGPISDATLSWCLHLSWSLLTLETCWAHYFPSHSLGWTPVQNCPAAHTWVMLKDACGQYSPGQGAQNW